jgi:hypothetical protein
MGTLTPGAVRNATAPLVYERIVFASKREILHANGGAARRPGPGGV